MDAQRIILEGVIDPMLLKQTKKVGGILVYYDVLAWDMNTEAVRGELLWVLGFASSAS
jgi:hypothetical protein